MAVWNTTTSSMVSEVSRIDADYFRPNYMDNQNSLSSAEAMRYVTREIIHPAEFLRRYVSSGCLVVRTQNVRPMEMVFSESDIFIPEEMALTLAQNRLRENDILLTRTGANFGQCSIFLGETRAAVATSHTFILRANELVDPAYLALFLNSRFGRTLLDQCAYGSAQPEIAPKFLLRFPFPRLTEGYEAELAQDVRKAYALRKKSSLHFREAKQLLESELGLDKLSFQKPVGFTARFSELETSRRFDSEHFYPAFHNFVAKLKRSVKLTRLGDHLSFCARGKQPCYSLDGLPVINSKHVQPNRVILSGNRKGVLGSNLDMEIRFDDLLINGTGRGTLGRAAPYLEKQNALPDNHVTILRSTETDPVFLSYYLNSAAGQMQVEMHQRGSSGQLELYPFDIRKFLVWDAPKALQLQVRELHEKASLAERESKRLLEEAKTRVEQLIEEAVKS